MSAKKVVALSFVMWGALGTLAQADPILAMESSSGGYGDSSNWSFWIMGATATGSSAQISDTAILSNFTTQQSSVNTSLFAPTTSNVATNTSNNTQNGTTTSSTATTTTPSSSTPPTDSAGPPPSGGIYDAYLNFGTGVLKEASTLTSGTAQPWYDSPAVKQAFGGQVPTTDQQNAFEKAVLNDVESTYQLSNHLAPSLTLNPTANAHHTMSVVSGLSYPGSPNAIGITDVGYNGFSFIDKLSYANNPTDLEWAVAHNITHELMHAFGVAQHDDKTGNFLDAATARWSLLTDPTARLSDQAAADIASNSFGRTATAKTGSSDQLILGGNIDGDEMLAAPVPEPSTIALWAVAGIGLFARRRKIAARLAA